ncbi:MAG: hypothetical protein ACYDA2_09495 [Acidimicrobiales bacterium]
MLQLTALVVEAATEAYRHSTPGPFDSLYVDWSRSDGSGWSLGVDVHRAFGPFGSRRVLEVAA